MPELVDVVRAWEAPGQADDGDRLILGWRMADVGWRIDLFRAAYGPVQCRCQGADSRVAEQQRDRDRAAEDSLQSGEDAGRGERVAAEFAEVVVQADAVQPQHLAPDTGD